MVLERAEQDIPSACYALSTLARALGPEAADREAPLVGATLAACTLDAAGAGSAVADAAAHALGVWAAARATSGGAAGWTRFAGDIARRLLGEATV